MMCLMVKLLLIPLAPTAGCTSVAKVLQCPPAANGSQQTNKQQQQQQQPEQHQQQLFDAIEIGATGKWNVRKLM